MTVIGAVAADVELLPLHFSSASSFNHSFIHSPVHNTDAPIRLFILTEVQLPFHPISLSTAARLIPSPYTRIKGYMSNRGYIIAEPRE